MFETDDDKREFVKRLMEEVGGLRLLVHCRMIYVCRDCRRREWMYCGVGVEGPSELKGLHLYVPSPFMSECRFCGGSTSHQYFGSDEEFDLIPLPLGERAFVIPKGGPNLEYLHSSVFSGEVYTQRVKR